MSELLIMGIGNTFMSDDGAGPKCIELLQQEKVPKNITLLDAGINSLSYFEEILTANKKVIIIDAMEGEFDNQSFAILAAKELDLPISLNSFSLHEFNIFHHLSLLPRKIQNKILIIGIKAVIIAPGYSLSPPTLKGIIRVIHYIKTNYFSLT